MPVDGDASIRLPDPPPPRPAARQQAIEAALRRFDGLDEPVVQPVERPSWARTHRRQVGALVTASLIAVISIPAIMVALRDHPTNVAPVPEAPQAATPAPVTADGLQPQPQADQTAPPPPAAVQEPGQVAPQITTATPPVQANQQEEPARMAERETPAEAIAPVAAAAPPPPSAPPPPPPPPPPAPMAERSAETADAMSAGNIIVTGSRVESPSLSKQNKAMAAPAVVIDTYWPFLADLQAAVRADDRGRVAGLVAYPLRVRVNGTTQVYDTPSKLERDFDEVFTPAVRRAILSQNVQNLRSRGRLKGNGRVWFGQTSPSGPVRIREVHP